jgi:hypothetical protein
MNRLHIATRGIASWRERLAHPDEQWRRQYSAFETAVSWEIAASTKAGLPLPIERLFQDTGYLNPVLMFAVAEHKVALRGGGGASQADVWAVIGSSRGEVSVAVEAKANESFGDAILKDWLIGSGSANSKANRHDRWEFVRSYLPHADSYLEARFQMLHRCAAAVIEAKRLGFQHAAFLVQAFGTPDKSFQDYAVFCEALKIPAKRGAMATTSVDNISLCIGWADCDLATDEQIASIA